MDLCLGFWGEERKAWKGNQEEAWKLWKCGFGGDSPKQARESNKEILNRHNDNRALLNAIGIRESDILGKMSVDMEVYVPA